jgi:hypothetical protein
LTSCAHTSQGRSRTPRADRVQPTPCTENDIPHTLACLCDVPQGTMAGAAPSVWRVYAKAATAGFAMGVGLETFMVFTGFCELEECVRGPFSVHHGPPQTQWRRARRRSGEWNTLRASGSCARSSTSASTTPLSNRQPRPCQESLSLRAAPGLRLRRRRRRRAPELCRALDCETRGPASTPRSASGTHCQ